MTILSDDTFVLLVGMSALCGVFEYFLPAKEIPRRHYALGVTFGLINIVSMMMLTPLLSLFTTALVRKFGVGLLDLRSLDFGDAGGAVFALLVSTLIADFFLYWSHRARHASAALWQTHLVHHSDEYMNVTTYARGHFTESILMPVLVTLPMAILFRLPPVSIALLSLVPRSWEYVTHANLKMGFGPLWWLITSPDYHRIHHSIEKRHFDRNFATWFPAWDVVFGTAWRPRQGERPATGVKGFAPRTVLELYAMPFRGWWGMVQGR